MDQEPIGPGDATTQKDTKAIAATSPPAADRFACPGLATAPSSISRLSITPSALQSFRECRHLPPDFSLNRLMRG